MAMLYLRFVHISAHEEILHSFDNHIVDVIR